MDQKKKPPVALPVKDTTKKLSLTRTQSPVYDEPRLGIGGGDEDHPTDFNDGYLEPIQIVAPSNSAIYSTHPIAGPSGDEDYDEPRQINVQGAPSGTNYKKGRNSSGEKFRNFLKGLTRNQAQKPSGHIYAEPNQFEGTRYPPGIVGAPGGYIDLESGDDKYSEFVTSGGAIYSNDSRNPSQDPVLQSNDRHVSRSERVTECWRRVSQRMTEYFRRLSELMPTFISGRSKRWILGLVAIVILLVLIMIVLAVYYAGFNDQDFSASSCPANQSGRASIGQSEIQVSWNENSRQLRGLARSHKSGDTFPAGKTTVVTYAEEDEVVCNFTVTVEAEGRPPNQIVVDRVTSTTLFISWAVLSDVSPTIDVSYGIYTEDEYGDRQTYLDAARRPAGSGLRALAYNLTGLTPGYGYNIVVSSSESVAGISGFVRTVPNQPGDITINQVSSKSIRISWVASEGFLHKYRITYKAAGNNDIILAGLVARSVTDYAILGLMETTDYEVFVEAISGNRASKPRGTERVMTHPTFLQTREINTAFITVGLPESDERLWLQIHGEKNLQFTVELPGPDIYINPDGEVEHHMFLNLVPGTLYRIQISKLPGGENPTLLDVLYARTVPNPPESVSAATPEITMNKITQTSIQWRAPTSVGIYDGFLVAYVPSDGHQTSPIQVDKTSQQVTIDGLDAGQKDYMVTVKTFSGMDYLLRTESNAVSWTFTVPGIPENDFIVRRITNTTIKLIWNIDARIDDILTNQKPKIILQSSSGIHQKDVVLSDKADNSYTFTGLTPGQTYNVTGVTTTGNKFATATVTTVPNPVSGLRVKQSTPNSITLQWDTLEGPYSKFEVVCTTGTNSQHKTSMTELEIRDLSANTEYTFSVVTISGDRGSNAVVITEYTTSPPPSRK
ncbi:fibronectin-like [Amphiura filiformis]|uniref:fibronectin-like n=1 Tax=Amphiura filiformis TaxID=82378 RepID=UPI003B212AB9